MYYYYLKMENGKWKMLRAKTKLKLIASICIVYMYCMQTCSVHAIHTMQYSTLLSVPAYQVSTLLFIYQYTVGTSTLLTYLPRAVIQFRCIGCYPRGAALVRLGGGRVLMHILLLQYYSSINYMHCSSITYLCIYSPSVTIFYFIFYFIFCYQLL